MTHSKPTGRDAVASIRQTTDAIFGRWPAWPWSVLLLIAAGGVVGAGAAPSVRAMGAANPAAIGTFACAGYGIVTAAFVALLPRGIKLLLLQRAAMRRPAEIDSLWWPLKLLPPALAATPTLRRTPEEFAAAVDVAGREVRGILAHRLWPAWMAAFIAPVLGLLTAWQNGATVKVELSPDAGPGMVLPALVSQVSPPMVVTITASLALMVTAVALDQWTKGLLQRWKGVIEVADGSNSWVVSQLSLDPVSESPGGRVPEQSSSLRSPEKPNKPEDKRPQHSLDPEELDRIFQQSKSAK